MNPASQQPVPQDAAQIFTIIDNLAHYAARHPAHPAYVDDSCETSYGDLYITVQRTAAWMAGQGVRAGDTVALPLDSAPALALHALEMIYAIAYVGAVMLPLYPEVPLESRIALIGRYGAHWLIASGTSQVAQARALDPRKFDRNDARYDSLPVARGDQPNGAFAYLFTSGTTGKPKALLPTHRQYFANMRAAAASMDMDRNDRHMAPVAWPSGVAMRYLFRSHAVGSTFVAVAMPDTRAALGAALARHGVTRLAASPWQLRRLLQSPSAPLPPLRSLQVIGAFVSDDELTQARAALTRNIYVGYGSNEIGALAVLGPPGAVSCSVGRLLPGVEVRVDDAQGNPLSAGGIGDLGFRADWMCTEYVDHPEATRERFRNGWFYPGDAGRVDAEGHIYLRGRTQEVINYGGLKIWPEDIEAALKQHPDVFDAALVGLPDTLSGERPAAFIVPRTPITGPLAASLSEGELRKFCAARIDAARVPALFVAIAEIPRNESGKIVREALVAAYQRARTALTGQTG